MIVSLDIGVQPIKELKMLTLAAIIYIFMCFISGWNIFWSIKMLCEGGLGDKAIAIVWGILLVCGLNA